jgi:ribonuclease Z
MTDTPLLEVVLTGTGVPHPSPGRAGAGVLVRYRHGKKKIALQFDAGRGTVLRLSEAGTPPPFLTALFLTHLHSDHLVDLPDVAMTRWIQQQLYKTGPLCIVTPEGGAARFARRMLEPFDEDIDVRREHTGAPSPEIDLRAFEASFSPQVVWSDDDESLTVTAVAVHHEPVPDAVAYRVDSPVGSVVISGDTRVCTEVEDLSRGANILVHEVCRLTAMRDQLTGTVFETIFSYHADSVPLGEMAQRAGVPHVVLTHLIPAPNNDDDESAFANDVRQGGYTGRLTVGRDLMTFRLPE